MSGAEGPRERRARYEQINEEAARRRLEAEGFSLLDYDEWVRREFDRIRQAPINQPTIRRVEDLQQDHAEPPRSPFCVVLFCFTLAFTLYIAYAAYRASLKEFLRKY